MSAPRLTRAEMEALAVCAALLSRIQRALAARGRSDIFKAEVLAVLQGRHVFLGDLQETLTHVANSIEKRDGSGDLVLETLLDWIDGGRREAVEKALGVGLEVVAKRQGGGE